jgi:hypothetical protein
MIRSWIGALIVNRLQDPKGTGGGPSPSTGILSQVGDSDPAGPRVVRSGLESGDD